MCDFAFYISRNHHHERQRKACRGNWTGFSCPCSHRTRSAKLAKRVLQDFKMQEIGSEHGRDSKELPIASILFHLKGPKTAENLK